MTSAFSLKRPVFFIGFMGAGKTSVARRIARVCSLVSIDMDTYLERREGKTIADIFAEAGEEGFRALESEVLRDLATRAPQMVSCGGGVVLRPENRALLKAQGCVVYLRVSAETAARRISDISTRPLFRSLEAARATNEARVPLYEGAADIIVDTEKKAVNGIAGEVIAALQKEGVLCQSPR
ncbi:MAG: shikimate kinase [Coriobacteriaceae bacterium]|jgi:shikimate kinase|nr:shikimate kinase [Coriobacteriaceae bacterium]